MPKPPKPNKRNSKHEDEPLSAREFKTILSWSGSTLAAARAAGCPQSTTYRMMKKSDFKQQLRLKQETMIKESAKFLARKITVCRADIINRLWELAQMAPDETSKSITGQIKAAETLSRIFDVKINRTADLDREVEGKTEEEMEFFVAHGYFPGPKDLENHDEINVERE